MTRGKIEGEKKNPIFCPTTQETKKLISSREREKAIPEMGYQAGDLRVNLCSQNSKIDLSKEIKFVKPEQ